MSIAVTNLKNVKHALRVRDGFETITGVLLGEASTYRPHKQANGKRWLDMKLYKTSDGEYVVYTIICSGIEEENRYRIRRTRSAFAVIEFLTLLREGKPYLPRDAALLLAEAANLDSDIREAYVNRAV